MKTRSSDSRHFVQQVGFAGGVFNGVGTQVVVGFLRLTEDLPYQ
jgi:hypothetical protein